jgi:hypothetical protein
VSKVIDMRNIFSHTQFNGDISKWRIGSGTRITDMFENAAFLGNPGKMGLNKARVMDAYGASYPRYQSELERRALKRLAGHQAPSKINRKVL